VVYSQIIGERYAVSVRGKLIAHFKTASTYPVLQYLLFLWFDFLSLFATPQWTDFWIESYGSCFDRGLWIGDIGCPKYLSLSTDR